jgi:adenosylcobinamide-GDP ribazoletransferase
MRASSPLLPLAAATAFLTRVPVGRFGELDGRAVARAAPLYPLVGAAVGALAGAVVDVLAGPLPAWAAATIGVGLAALLTGGMHLDALADTADALGGGTRERRLEIMRDHSIGSFGAVALVLVLVLEISLLAELGARDLALVSFAAAGALSRWSPLPIALALPYARDDGQGRSLATGISLAVVLVGLAVAAGIAAIALGSGAAAALGAAAGVALVLGLFYRRWLGGVTGDALGATAKLCETAALVAFVAAA